MSTTAPEIRPLTSWDIHFLLFLSQHTVWDAPPRGTRLRKLYWGRKVGREREKKSKEDEKSPAHSETRTHRLQIMSCVLYHCATTATQCLFNISLLLRVLLCWRIPAASYRCSPGTWRWSIGGCTTWRRWPSGSYPMESQLESLIRMPGWHHNN